jgi:hypothetical protein
MLMNLKDITFDEKDGNLFQVDDTRLRADAIQHSVLPRLHVLMNQCIASIRSVYGIEVLEDSRVSFYPHFRRNRTNKLEHLYDAAFVGLGGKVVLNKWHGFKRQDKKEVQFLPFRFGLQLKEEGLVLFLENYWLKGLTDKSYKKLFNFHLRYEPLIHRLCYYCGIEPFLRWGDGLPLLSTQAQHYNFMLENRFFDNYFWSNSYFRYPITPHNFKTIIEYYTVFYPIYDSYIQIAKAEPPRFEALVAKASKWLEASMDEEKPRQTSIGLNNIAAKEAAEQKIKVMPAIRWQVFQRDNWKCVACGKGSHQNAILQVDHIRPRSKGGEDTIDNFQTLCHICNSGKSNRDDTDLRAVNIKKV